MYRLRALCTIREIRERGSGVSLPSLEGTTLIRSRTKFITPRRFLHFICARLCAFRISDTRDTAEGGAIPPQIPPMITVIHGQAVVEINATCTLDPRASIVAIKLSRARAALHVKFNHETETLGNISRSDRETVESLRVCVFSFCHYYLLYATNARCVTHTLIKYSLKNLALSPSLDDFFHERPMRFTLKYYIRYVI